MMMTMPLNAGAAKKVAVMDRLFLKRGVVLFVAFESGADFVHSMSFETFSAPFNKIANRIEPDRGF